jgi:hypothetical protein
MPAARKLRLAPRPDPLEVFRLRAWARAYLCWVGELDFYDAIDALQVAAETQGLIQRYGQDRIQAAIAAGFREGMPRC